LEGNTQIFKWDGKDINAENKSYELTIKEVSINQHPIDAMEINPTIYKLEISNNESANITFGELDIKDSLIYGWQVITYDISNSKEKNEISRSTIRTFAYSSKSDVFKFLRVEENPKEQKLERSAAPPPPSNCENSNVELGNFQRWTGYYGNRLNSSTINLNNLSTGIVNGRHTIRQTSDGFDPQVGGNILPQVSEGNYSIRLGNRRANGQADLISYTFQVNQQNQKFSFQYALVLEDPNHDDNEQPFFGYYILRGNSILLSLFNLPVANDYVVSESNNPFFKTRNGIVYREWTPTCIDLSNYIGETMTIVFYVADCAQGGHFGYAYIDALCENNNAISSFTMPNKICLGDDLIVDGTASLNETSHFWSIEESDANWGRKPHTEVYEWFVAQNVGIKNLNSFYASKGRQFACNTYYRIKLAVNNECTPWHETVKLLYVQCPDANAGADICCSDSNFPKLIGGGLRQPNHTYSWSPQLGVSLPNNSISQINCDDISEFNHFIYTLTVTDGDGCTATDDVSVFFEKPLLNLAAVREGCCSYRISISNSQGIVDVSWSNGTLHDRSILVTQPGIYSVTATNACGQTTKSITIPNFNITIGFFNVIAYNSKFYPPSGGGGYSDKFYIKDVMSGNGASGIPNSYNATEYKLLIFNRWGNLFRTITGTSCNGFDNWSINWDGKDQNGTLVQQGVYVWKLYFKNCQYKNLTYPKERRFKDRFCLDCRRWPGNGCGFWKRCKQWNVPGGTTEDVIITEGRVTVVR